MNDIEVDDNNFKFQASLRQLHGFVWACYSYLGFGASRASMIDAKHEFQVSTFGGDHLHYQLQSMKGGQSNEVANEMVPNFLSKEFSRIVIRA